MKTVFRLTLLSALLGLAITTFPREARADTTPDVMHISCKAPNPAHQTGLHRPKGDGDHWTFSIVLDGDARFVDGPHWSFPGKNGNDPDWGMVAGGADGDSSMEWWSPGKTGDFQVRVNGQIVCGDGGDGAPIDFSAGWDGKVEYNAEIKVRRKDSGDDYSSSATVAAGGKSISEHQADVVVIATDDDGNPMEDITVDTPTIQNGEGVAIDASISPSSATTDSEGKAYFTFTSSDIVENVTLEEDGGESSASASIQQNWTAILAAGNWDYDEYFYYDTPSPISFKMALDSDGTVPIRGHDIGYVPTKIVGVEWDPDAGWDWDGDGFPDGDYEPKILNRSEIDTEKYRDLVSFGNNDGKAAEAPGGTYTAQLTVPSNDNFWVDSVDFNVVDWKIYA